jgi:hypothetical protein
MVVESWLNECTQSQTRGRVFSIYMTLTYMGIGIGQQLLNFGGEDGRNLFLIAALLFSLSLIPVSATRSVHPELPQPTRYNFKALFQKVPIGMLGKTQELKKCNMNKSQNLADFIFLLIWRSNPWLGNGNQG